MAKAKTKDEPRCCLIGIDENESSAMAFEFYVNHIHRSGSKIVIVHVVPPHVWSTNHPYIHLDAAREQAMSDEKEKVARLQESYEAMMKLNGIPGRINVIYYVREIGKVLCKIANEENCSMIVVGQRRTHTNDPDSLGSVVDYVLRKSKCPVIIARKIVEEAYRNGPRLSFSPTFGESHEQPVSLVRRTSVDFKIRKISCPDMQMSPPTYAELSMSNDGKFLDVPEPVKERRHSSIINPFRQLSFFNGGRKIPSTKEED